MKSLMYLEAALLEGKAEEVSAYFAEIDRQTSNDMMRKAGVQFGFKTLEVRGMVIANQAETARILGYTDPSSLAQLLNRYQIMTYQIGWYEHDTRNRIRETFGLSEKDGRSTFHCWDSFCVGGMYGRNEAAEKVKLYLLKMETVGRVALAADPKLDLAAKNYELRRLERQIVLADKVQKMPEGVYKDIGIEALEKLTGRVLPRSAQADLFKDK